MINANSTFEYGRRGKAEAVGFWRLQDDVLVLDMMSSPVYLQHIQPQLKASNGYDIYSLHAAPIDMQQDQFNAVASRGDLIQQFTLQRCQ